MSFHFPRRTFYTILVGFLEHYGHLINNADQLRIALQDLEELTDFALYKMDTAIDSDAAKKISRSDKISTQKPNKAGRNSGDKNVPSQAVAPMHHHVSRNR